GTGRERGPPVPAQPATGVRVAGRPVAAAATGGSTLLQPGPTAGAPAAAALRRPARWWTGSGRGCRPLPARRPGRVAGRARRPGLAQRPRRHVPGWPARGREGWTSPRADRGAPAATGYVPVASGRELVPGRAAARSAPGAPGQKLSEP